MYELTCSDDILTYWRIRWNADCLADLEHARRGPPDALLERRDEVVVGEDAISVGDAPERVAADNSVGLAQVCRSETGGREQWAG